MKQPKFIVFFGNVEDSEVEVSNPKDYKYICYPEINKHPSQQRALVPKILEQLSVPDGRVILVTVSDYIIKELNIIFSVQNLHRVPDQLSSYLFKAGYSKSLISALDKNTLIVYDLAVSSKTPCEITDNGIILESVDAVIDEMNELEESLYLV